MNGFVEKLHILCPKLVKYFVVSLKKTVVELGLEFMQAQVLLYLSKGQEHFSQGEIREYLASSASMISRFMDKMECAELVKRSINPHDRRENIMELTDIGKEKAHALVKRVNEIYDEMLSFLTEDEQVELFVYVEKITKGLDSKKEYYE